MEITIHLEWFRNHEWYSTLQKIMEKMKLLLMRRKMETVERKTSIKLKVAFMVYVNWVLPFEFQVNLRIVTGHYTIQGMVMKKMKQMGTGVESIFFRLYSRFSKRDF